VNVRLYTAVHCAVVIGCILWGLALFVAVVCSVTLIVWWGRYKFEARCDNYSRCIGSNSNVCMVIDEWTGHIISLHLHLHFIYISKIHAPCYDGCIRNMSRQCVVVGSAILAWNTRCIRSLPLSYSRMEFYLVLPHWVRFVLVITCDICLAYVSL